MAAFYKTTPPLVQEGSEDDCHGKGGESDAPFSEHLAGGEAYVEPISREIECEAPTDVKAEALVALECSQWDGLNPLWYSIGTLSGKSGETEVGWDLPPTLEMRFVSEGASTVLCYEDDGRSGDIESIAMVSIVGVLPAMPSGDSGNI